MIISQYFEEIFKGDPGELPKGATQSMNNVTFGF